MSPRADRTELLRGTLDMLERKGWLSAKWESRDGKRELKYYRLSASGRKQLAAE